MSRRPLGITIGAILFAANAAHYVGFATLAILSRDGLRSLLRALSPSGMGPEAAHMAMGRLLLRGPRSSEERRHFGDHDGNAPTGGRVL